MTAPKLSTYLLPRRPAGIWLMGLALLLTAVAVVLCWSLLAQRAERKAIDRRLVAARAAVAARPAPKPDKTTAEQQKRWADLRLERNFSWAPLFNALEAAGNPDIELLEFRPEKTSGSVLLRGEAKDEAALLDFMDRLSRGRALKQVHLSHRKQRQRDRLVTLTFEIKAVIATSAQY